MTTRQAIIDEAMSWLGTPYHHHGRLKGIGVDCAMLLAEVYERAGVIERVDAGVYPCEWHLHQNEELFIDWLKHVGAQPVDDPQVGDVAIFRYGRTFSHGGILVAPFAVLHSYISLGVSLHRFDEAPLAGRPYQFWSVLDGR